MRIPTLSTLLAATTFAAACASATPGRSGRAADILTGEQLVATGAETVYQAVQRLQPDWLSTRGPTSVNDPVPTAASVYMDGVEIGDIERLRSIRVTDVERVRYFGPGAAGVRFGMGHQRGVIEVTRKQSSGPSGAQAE